MVAPKPYKIRLHKEVTTEDSRRFDKSTKEKIKKKCIEILGSEPEKAGQPLRGQLSRYRKLKIFDAYRIIYRVDRKKHEVLLLAVGLRRDEETYQDAIKRLGAV